MIQQKKFAGTICFSSTQPLKVVGEHYVSASPNLSWGETAKMRKLKRQMQQIFMMMHWKSCWLFFH